MIRERALRYDHTPADRPVLPRGGITDRPPRGSSRVSMMFRISKTIFMKRALASRAREGSGPGRSDGEWFPARRHNEDTVAEVDGSSREWVTKKRVVPFTWRGNEQACMLSRVRGIERAERLTMR